MSMNIALIKFVSDLQQVGGFTPGTPVSSTNIADRHDITEILLNVVLNTITLTLTCFQENILTLKSMHIPFLVCLH